MDSTSKSSWFQELLQKHMHFSNALLKLVLNDENRRAVKNAKLEIDTGIEALQVEVALRRRIVESSNSYLERGHSFGDMVAAGTREHRESVAAIIVRRHLSDTHQTRITDRMTRNLGKDSAAKCSLDYELWLSNEQ